MQEQKAQYSMVMLIVFLAVILGVFAFAIYLFIQGRPLPEETAVLVGDQTISLSIDPNARAEIVGDVATPPPVVEEVPVEAAPETVTLEEATAVPAAPETAQEGQGGTPSEMYIYTQHVVQGTDTLFSLANQYGTTIPLMARFGTAVLLPGASVTITQANPAYCPTSGWYIAREGDTPGGIAAAYNTTLENLDQLNRWGGVYAVYETDVVCVP